jgi:hypothetical protein
MTQNIRSTKQPTTKDGRQIAYERHMCVEICEKLVRGEDLKVICGKLPMPPAPIFLKWIQENPEGRAIHRCAMNFISDRTLANTLDVPFDYSAGDWANAVRAKLERGHPIDYIDRPYIPPDWTKVYPLIGDPPVWSTEDMATYNNLRDEYTQMLRPDDLLQLTWTKEAVDATWECAREARSKNAEPQRQYRQRRINEAIAKRQERVKIEPATADDLSNGFIAGLKRYQALDMAQARKMKRRDSALRHIERWREGLGGKAKALSDKFISEQALAERYGGAHLAGADTDDRVPEATEPAPPVAPDQVDAPSNCAGDAVQKARPVDLSGEPQKAAPPAAPADPMTQSASAADPANAAQAEPTANPANTAEAASLLADTGEAAPAPTDHALGAAPPPPPVEKTAQVAPTASGETGQVAPPPAPAQESAQTKAEGASKIEPADAAPPRVPAHEVEVEVGGVSERINFVAWLWGAKRYHWDWLAKAGEKAFERPFTSKVALVRYLVLDCNMVRQDEVCPLLAPWLRESEFPSLSLFGAAAKAASAIGASGETPGAASPLASEAGSAEVVPAEHPAGAQAAPSVGSSARSAALSDKAAEAARRRVRAEHQQAIGPAASRANGPAAPPLASAQKSAQATAAAAFQKKPAAAAPPRTPAHEVEISVDGLTVRVDWMAWLKGAQRYPDFYLIRAGEKAFKRTFSSKCALLRKLVLECKMIPPDQLCPELAYLFGKLEPRRMARPGFWEARP